MTGSKQRSCRRRRAVGELRHARDWSFLKAARNPSLPAVWVAGSQILAFDRGLEGLLSEPARGSLRRARDHRRPCPTGTDEVLVQVFRVSTLPRVRSRRGRAAAHGHWTATHLLVKRSPSPSSTRFPPPSMRLRHRPRGLFRKGSSGTPESPQRNPTHVFLSGRSSAPSPLFHVDHPWTIDAFRERARDPTALPRKLRRQILRLFSQRSGARRSRPDRSVVPGPMHHGWSSDLPPRPFVRQFIGPGGLPWAGE